MIKVADLLRNLLLCINLHQQYTELGPKLVILNQKFIQMEQYGTVVLVQLMNLQL
jgi:hypothetical protein